MLPAASIRRDARSTAWVVALLAGPLVDGACRARAGETSTGVAAREAGGLPEAAPPRRLASELGAPPLHAVEARWDVYVDGVSPPDARFPLARGVDMEAGGAPPGTRYWILRADHERGRTVRVGEVELTDATCPPGGDGAPLPCRRCPADAGVRFARWVDAPAQEHVVALAEEGATMLAVGPLTAERRARWEDARMHTPCALPGAAAAWDCYWALDLEGDGRADLLRAIHACPTSHEDVIAGNDPRAREPRCFADERWRQDSGRWWATAWSPYLDYISIPFIFRPRPASELEFFDVSTLSPGPGERGRQAVQLSAVISYRPARPESTYLLVDGRAPVGLARTVADAGRAAKAFVDAPGALSEPLYAIGPVADVWPAWAGARVTSDFSRMTSTALSMPFEPTDRERLLVGVDLDGDGRRSLEVRASAASMVRLREPQRFVRLDLWVGDDDGSRTLREYALYSLGTRGFVYVAKCDVLGAGPSL